MGRYQFVTVGYESCEKNFKKLGFRNQRLTGLSYLPRSKILTYEFSLFRSEVVGKEF